MADDATLMGRRPRTVVAVAIFLLLSAAIALLIAASLLFPNPFGNQMWDLNRPAHILFEQLGKMPSVLLLAMAITTGLMARAL
jgi:hypothetical protein